MSESLHQNTIFNLQGRVALVTGGGTGIGWQIASGLAQNGAKVYISGRRKETLESAAKDFAGKHQDATGSIIPLTMDVTDRASIAAARDVIASNEGKLHILVNNAGQTGPVSPWFEDPNSPQRQNSETIGRGLFEGESFESWSSIYSVNAFSVFFVSTAFLGLLSKGSEDVAGHTSSIVNITSISGQVKLSQNHFAYNSAKAAASHLTKMMATEFALKDVPVRVCAVSPGVWESEMTAAKITPEMVDRVGKGLQPVPAKRPGLAGEIAGTVIYLASPAGCYTNGQETSIASPRGEGSSVTRELGAWQDARGGRLLSRVRWCSVRAASPRLAARSGAFRNLPPSILGLSNTSNSDRAPVFALVFTTLSPRPPLSSPVSRLQDVRYKLPDTPDVLNLGY